MENVNVRQRELVLSEKGEKSIARVTLWGFPQSSIDTEVNACHLLALSLAFFHRFVDCNMIVFTDTLIKTGKI